MTYIILVPGTLESTGGSYLSCSSSPSLSICACDAYSWELAPLLNCELSEQGWDILKALMRPAEEKEVLRGRSESFKLCLSIGLTRDK